MCLRDSPAGNYKKPAGEKKYQKNGESGLIRITHLYLSIDKQLRM